MQYTPLIETASSRGSIISINPDDDIRSHDHLCRTCKTKLMKKQQTDHTPIECLSQRCILLEKEVTRLTDHDMKSRLQIKELENKLVALEDAVEGLITPKQQQATPFSFGIGHKVRHQLKKSNSEDIQKKEINYDNIIHPPSSNSRERVGLFGSLGASSQEY